MCVRDGDGDTLCEGVSDVLGVAEPDGVVLGVAATLGDCEIVPLNEGVFEGVSVDDGVCEKLWDGDCEFVIDCEEVDVNDAEVLCELLDEIDGLCVDDGDNVILGVRETEAVRLCELETELVLDCDALCDWVTLGVLDCELVDV